MTEHEDALLDKFLKIVQQMFHDACVKQIEKHGPIEFYNEPPSYGGEGFLDNKIFNHFHLNYDDTDFDEVDERMYVYISVIGPAKVAYDYLNLRHGIKMAFQSLDYPPSEKTKISNPELLRKSLGEYDTGEIGGLDCYWPLETAMQKKYDNNDIAQAITDLEHQFMLATLTYQP